MKRFSAFLFLFSWVFGYMTQIRFPLIVLDVSAGLLLMANWKTLLVSFKRQDAGVVWVLGILGVFSLSWVVGLRIFPIREAFPGLLYLVRISMYILVLRSAKEFFRPVTQWIPVALWMFLLFGHFQYVFLPDTRFLLYSGWDEHYYRLIGSVLDPNYMGAMMGVIGLFGLARFIEKQEQRWLLLSVASFVSLVLTFSRAAWIATIVGGLLLALRLKRRRLMVLGIFGVLAMIGVFFVTPKPGGEGVRLSRTISVFERLVSWQNAVKIWQYQPLVGVGFNNYKAATFRYGLLTDPSSHASNAPSSSWLLLLATLGIFGVFGMLGVLKKTVMNLWHDPLWSAIAALVGVHAAFNNTLFYVPMLAMLAILRGTSNPPTASR